MPANVISFVLQGDASGLAKGLADAERKSRSSAGRIAGAFGVVASGIAAGGAAAVAFGALATKAASDVDDGYREIRTLLPDISDEAFGKLRDDVQLFSLEARRSIDEIIPALYQALSAGVPEGNVIDFLAEAELAAVGGKTGLETVRRRTHVGGQQLWRRSRFGRRGGGHNVHRRPAGQD